MLKDKSTLPEIENQVLKFWEKAHIFEKTIKQRRGKKSFSFYDGPPFATGLPHYGHILATTIKDTVTRFWTMKGYKVERRVGWDCHGLPIENLIEKELKLKDKEAIESFGVENFNNACRTAVFRSVSSFQKTLQRVGRWADYSRSYATLDNSYIESVWWVFKQLWDGGLIYSDYRVSPYCPRCGTSLSNFEVTEGYKNTTDPAIFVKFRLKNESDNIPTYFVAWTTTPWTLTANAALAVKKDIDYAFVVRKNGKGKERLILAKARLAAAHLDSAIIEKTVKGKDLKGMEYVPMFSFVRPDKKAHIVILADFVSVEDGSGIVHIAPAFGADDLEEARKNDIPIILTVNKEGRFIDEVTLWAGEFVKKTDEKIIEYLRLEGVLLKQETIDHQYPFCWRCDSPLLYYPIDNWYVAVTKIKNQLVENNKKIRWVPTHLKEGRFGKWLADARDWVISRDRFWGAPIPVWKCVDCDTHTVVGSLKQLAKITLANNKYFLTRHGEADSNVLNIVSSFPEKTVIKLTNKGKKQVLKTAKELKQKKIDFIITSPLQRASETAKIIADYCGLKYEIDDRLAECSFGLVNGRPVEEFEALIKNEQGKFITAPEGGETLIHVRKRMLDLVKELEKKYVNKKILLVGHRDALWVLEGATQGIERQELIKQQNKMLLKTGGWKELKFGWSPLDKNGELDIHRPYIDEVEARCSKCGGKAIREKQVFDCWFESGAMPYASWHYPFENRKKVKNIFPADFIAEGLDQTRGWFYTLHVIATALTARKSELGKNQPAFKNVVVNGLILDEFGRKLSKKLRNYTEPEALFEKTGADALRYFLLSSASIGEDYRFADKGVIEAKTKISERLLNSYNFFAMYADVKQRVRGYKDSAKESVLDRWIKARIKQTVAEINSNMEKYELTQATRPIADLLDDLSNWYIRRSRTRLQRPESVSDFYTASKTLYDVLIATTKIMAPFTPFIAEAVYKSLTNEEKSVHLTKWPNPGKLTKKEKSLIDTMVFARIVASQILAQRAEKGIKVKQPLASYKTAVKELAGKAEVLALIADEVNVKKVIYDASAPAEGVLDTEITGELREEGALREITRLIQDMRQKAGLKPKAKAVFHIYSDNKELNQIITKNITALKKDFALSDVVLKKDDDMKVTTETKIAESEVWAGIR